MSWLTDVLVHAGLLVSAMALVAAVVGGCALRYDVGHGQVELERTPSASSSINSPPPPLAEPSSIRQARQ